MKKLVMVLLLTLSVVMTSAGMKAAEGDLIELYPYDQEACLTTVGTCAGTKVGDAHWDLVYNGYRYNLVGNSTRYVSEFHDDDSDGFYSDVNEVTAISYSAFAALTINDTDETYIIKTANLRATYTVNVVNRIYAYFDKLGKLQMFEDHVHTYHIFNDGTILAPDWRLATATEIADYTAADPKPVNMRLTHVRMKIDATDTDGYVLEPLKYLTWTNADVDTTTELDVEKWSTIVAGNPNYITIPSGWSVISFGANDRGSYVKPLAFIQSMPKSMANSAVANAVISYDPQPAKFAGITALDNDLTSPGVNIVVGYQAAFDLSNTVSVSWLKMFNATGKIVNKTEKLDYKVEIVRDDVVLETINFTYDAGTDKYTASAPVTKIDSSEFGAGYKARYIATNPENQVTTVEADIVVGVMPPKFIGVKDRFHDENTYVNLMEGITADDGYGTNVTNSVKVTTPSGFNFYNPRAGSYLINLEFTHHVHFAGEPTTVTIKAEVLPLVTATDVNQSVAINVHAKPMIFTDVAKFKAAGTAYGSVMVKAAADGTMKESFDRFNWAFTDVNGTVIKDETQFNAWKAAMTLEEGEFIVTAHGAADATRLRVANLPFGSVLKFNPGKADFDYDIITKSSYNLTIDDKTAPELVVINNNFKFEAGDFATVNEAILSNVVAIDNHDSRNDVAIFVTANGGLSLTTPGTYNVTVNAEDKAGNVSSASFSVVVVAKALTPVIVDDKIDQKVNDKADQTEQELKDYIAENTLTLEQIQALVDAKPDTKGTSIGVTIAISFASAAMAFGVAFLVLRKRP